MSNVKTYALVLSGGGALGAAHLLVIQKLFNAGHRFDEYVGTSVGAIIAACLAIEKPLEEIEALLNRFASLSQWVAFSLFGNSLISNTKIEKIAKSVFSDIRMNEIEKPLKIIATDLSDGRKKVFDNQCDVMLYSAVLASMAIPGVFEEQRIGERYYGDGFLVENLGIATATADVIIALDVLGEASYNAALPQSLLKSRNVMAMFEKSMKLLIINQTRHAIKAIDHQELILIDIPTVGYKTFDFKKIAQIKQLSQDLELPLKVKLSP